MKRTQALQAIEQPFNDTMQQGGYDSKLSEHFDQDGNQRQVMGDEFGAFIVAEAMHYLDQHDVGRGEIDQLMESLSMRRDALESIIDVLFEIRRQV